MDAGDPIGLPLTDARGDAGAPVAALGAEPPVAEPGHQLAPRIGYPLDPPPGAAGLSLKP
jgi:hypothetical protein